MSWSLLETVTIDYMFVLLEPKELLCEQKEHVKIIEKGKPEDVVVGIKNVHVSSETIFN